MGGCLQMHSVMKKVLSVTMGAALLGASAASLAEDELAVDINEGKNIFMNGKGDVPACQSCHGPQGMGNDSMGTPRLAGQVFAFVVKQLEDFATDKRQDTTMYVMNANAKGLSPQDRKNVAAYVNSLTTQGDKLSNLQELKTNGSDVGTTYIGKSIINYGIPAKGVPACRSCHGYNGRGVGPVYPKIGEQKYVYLVNQLKKWRDGSRANDPMSQMQHVAQKMSDEDIYNAASFLAGAEPLSVGNTRMPAEEKPFGHGGLTVTPGSSGH